MCFYGKEEIQKLGDLDSELTLPKSGIFPGLSLNMEAQTVIRESLLTLTFSDIQAVFF